MTISVPRTVALATALLLPLALACGGASRQADQTSPQQAAEEPPVEPAAATPSAAPAAYVEEIHQWRADREKSLLRPGGWLTLVGLDWLSPGENTFGSASGNALVFPAKAPAHAGTLVLGDDGSVTLEPAAGAELSVVHEQATDDDTGDGGEETLEPLTGPIPLVPDTEKDTTTIALGPLRFWVIVRGDKTGIRLLDRESPAIAAFQGLESFPIDPAWKVEAHLERQKDFTVPMPNILGQVEDVPSPGILHFQAPSGEELSLVPIGEGDELFLVFGDKTNGHTTYGGGRFLYADAPAADDEDPVVVLDFNRAYNPPCAFTEFATCPLPPRQNKLPIAVEAGEKRYAGGPTHHAPAAGG